MGVRTFGKNRSGGSTNKKSTTKYRISVLFEIVKEYSKEFAPKIMLTIKRHLRVSFIAIDFFRILGYTIIRNITYGFGVML